MALRYVGAGRFLPGIPATDLDGSTVERLARERGLSVTTLRARLVASGLYVSARKGMSHE